jgi:glycosyltransferase involved in cell wall biosynthesis
MRLICLHHRLGGFSSHHFNESWGFIQEFRARGREFLLLVNKYAQRRVVRELKAKAVLDDPTFRMEWSFEERSRRFVKMLHRRVDRTVKAGDCLLLPVSTQLEAHGLTRWLQELPAGKRPWIVVVFHSDRWNRAGRDEYERQIAEFRILHGALAALSAEDARKMLFFAVTELLAAELTDLLGTNVGVVPMPLIYGEMPLIHGEMPSTEAPPSSPPLIAILGGTRREKGSHLIPDIIRACRARMPLQFIVQLTNNTLTPEEVERLAVVEGEPGVRIIRDAMPLADYHAALLSADAALFPYELIPYRKRSSGVFAEAVAYGKPVLATAGTWMAEQIAAGRAAGIVFDALTPEAIADAVHRCVSDLPAFRRSAHEKIAAWRNNVSVSAFVDVMEREIAVRARTG